MRAHSFLLLSLGLAISTQSPVLPSLASLMGTAVVLLAVYCAVRRYRHHAGWFCLTWLFMGLLLGLVQGHRLQASLLPASLENETLEWQGCLLDDPVAQWRGRSADWRFEVLVNDAALLQSLNGYRVRVSTSQDASAMEPGRCYRFTSRLRRPRGLSSPGAQAYDGLLLGNGVRALARASSLVPVPEVTLGGWRGLALHMRAAWMQQIHALQASPVSTRLMLTVLAGDTAAMTAADWNMAQATGTTHIWVVSGLHIGLAAWLGFVLGYGSGQLLLLVRVPANTRTIGLVGAWLAAWVFCFLSGAGVAAVRSALMFSIAGLCLFSGRPKAVSTGLCMSAFVIVGTNPWVVYLPGFWLSFTAVACLWLVLALRRPASAYGYALCQAQWAIGLGLFPLLLFFGKPLSACSALVNILAIPLVALWVPLLMCLVLISFWVPLPAWSVQGLDALNDALWSSLGWAATHLGGVHWWPTPGMVAVWCMGMGVVCWLLPCSWRIRSLMLIGLLPWWFPFQASLQSGEFRLHVLDVGQGQAVIVQTADHLLLYDAGPAWPDGWNTAQAIIWPMLGQMGAHRIDRIMISHADNDHAGGLGWLRQQFPDTPVLQTGLPGQGQRCQQGEQWHWNGVRFSVLHPGNAIEAGNNGSCVLRVDNGRFVALLPGDIERAIEYRLLAEQPDALQADWLLAPHHGSRTSSSWPWAKAVSPKQVVYSAGYRNRFGHPAEDIVRRWQQLGAQSLQTAHCGTYSMRVDSQGQWQQRCYRTAWKPWWRDL